MPSSEPRGLAAVSHDSAHRQKNRHALWGLAFVTPAILLFVFIVAFPVGWTFWLSLHDSSLLRPGNFVQLKNYARLLDDRLFWQSLWVTSRWTVGVVPSIILLSLPLAILLFHPWVRFRGLFRTGYFLPVVTDMVAAAFIWRWLFAPGFGPINYALGLVGARRPGWLVDPAFALAAIMVVSVWRQIGRTMVLFLAGLQTIPQELLEAALIDGASTWQLFRRITLPLLNPVILLVAVTLTINGLRVFTIPYVMSSGGLQGRIPGGPLDATRVFALHIYTIGFRQFELGYASANAVVLMLLIIAVTLAQIRFLQRPFEY